MASETYARVDHGIDIRGMRWAVGTRGRNVEITVDPKSSFLRFDGDGRDQFIKAYAEAERQAELRELLDRAAMPGQAERPAEAEADLCCRCGQPMPASVMNWWISADGHYCSEKCANEASGG